MASQVIPLRRHHQNEESIAILEELLASARRGEITGVAVAADRRGKSTLIVTAGTIAQDDERLARTVHTALAHFCKLKKVEPRAEQRLPLRLRRKA